MDNKDQYQRFYDAARELESRGEKASLRAVRALVGGGSMTDVCAAMQIFRHQSVAPSTVDSDVPQAMLDAVRALYLRAQSIAFDVVSTERKALEDAQAALKLFRDEMEELAADVEREREEALSAAVTANTRADASIAELNVCRGRNAQLEELLEGGWRATDNHPVSEKERRTEKKA